MKRIRTVREEIENEENQLLFDRDARTRRDVVETKGACVVGTCASFGILLFAFGRLRQEIRRRRQSERALRASENNLATTLQSIGDGVIATDVDGRLVQMNKVAEQMTGWDFESALQRTFGEVFQIVNEETGEAAKNPVNEVLKDGKAIAVAGNTGLRGKDGTERPIAHSAAPIRDTEGDLRGVVLVFRDVTADRVAEKAIQRANRFLDSIVENIPDMIFVKEAGELRFERINRAGEELIGVERKDLIGRNDFDFFPREQAEEFQARDRETLAAHVVVEIPEEPILTKHGERWLHTKKVPIVDERGTPRYLLGISADITERRRGAASLKAAMDAAKAANQELEAFSYSVAHDLRAPLRAIDGFSLALEEDCGDKLDKGARDHLDRVRSAARQMGHLIDGLLGLSQVTRGELRREKVNLTRIAAESGKRLREAQPDRRVDLRVQEGLVGEGDPNLLAAALNNLLGNAWKFTGKRADVRIEVGKAVERGETVFFVRDNGVGFDQAYAHKLFGAFQRLHGATEFEGTGIGLATVQRIVRRHGGRIWAEGEVGRGATFYFTL